MLKQLMQKYFYNGFKNKNFTFVVQKVLDYLNYKTADLNHE